MAFRVAATNPRPEFDFALEREALDPIGAEIVPVYANDSEAYRDAVAEADAIIIGPKVRLTAEVIRGLRHCRVIASGGIGVDSVDLDAATEAGIPVANIHDVFVEEVADQALLLLLAVNRKLLFCHEMATTNRWAEGYTGLGSMPKIHGKTLGLVAFGNIAKAVARRSQAFGLRVLAFDPYVPAADMEVLDVEPRSLEDLLRESDFVSAHAPLTPETDHMLGEAQFALMRPAAIFVNTGRGRVVDEPALIRALAEGRIAGAGLDVLEHEPPDPANPLLRMPNVVVTPHMASYSNESNRERRRRLGQNIAAVLTGRRPANVVNRAVLERLSLT
jgi:D-3-phosphoglycerate dehydrogenase